MTSDHDDDARIALDRFRHEAQAMGFGTDDPADSLQLETTDDFIARMKRADDDDATPRRTAVVDRPTSLVNRKRRWILAVTAVAASTALIYGIARPGGSPASAAAPPVLDFEFASAVRIAYAPGEDAGPSLQLLADAADKQPEALPGSGQVQYKKSDNWFADHDDAGSVKIVPRVSETWLRPNGSLTTHEAVGRPLRADGRGAVADAGTKLVDETLKPGTIDAEFAQALPSDPAKLADALLDHIDCPSRSVGIPRSMCLYSEIVNLNQTYVMPSTLTAAIWRMLESEAGFRSLGSAEDRAGRNALGISIIDPAKPSVRHILLGSQDTGALVGDEDILIKVDPNLDVKPPSVLSFSTVLDARMTTSAPR
ncbi:MAG: CU044_5270 family protein [Aeromicrobium sp.]